MTPITKKWLAAFALGALLIFALWRPRRAVEKIPAAAPATAPVPAPAAPIAVSQEARPAPPLMTAKKPISVKPRAATPPAKTIAAPPVPPAPRAVLPPVVLPPPAPEPLEWSGNDSAVTHSGEVLIKNDRQWVEFWSEHRPHEAAPEIDFTRQVVIGVFAGPRPADQFKIQIENIRATPSAVWVDYRETLPPPGTFAVNVTVYPYHIKAIPRPTLPVKFNKLPVINPNR